MRSAIWAVSLSVARIFCVRVPPRNYGATDEASASGMGFFQKKKKCQTTFFSLSLSFFSRLLISISEVINLPQEKRIDDVIANFVICVDDVPVPVTPPGSTGSLDIEEDDFSSRTVTYHLFSFCSIDRQKAITAPLFSEKTKIRRPCDIHQHI